MLNEGLHPSSSLRRSALLGAPRLQGNNSPAMLLLFDANPHNQWRLPLFSAGPRVRRGQRPINPDSD